MTANTIAQVNDDLIKKTRMYVVPASNMMLRSQLKRIYLEGIGYLILTTEIKTWLREVSFFRRLVVINVLKRMSYEKEIGCIIFADLERTNLEFSVHLEECERCQLARAILLDLTDQRVINVVVL